MIIEGLVFCEEVMKSQVVCWCYQMHLSGASWDQRMRLIVFDMVFSIKFAHTNQTLTKVRFPFFFWKLLCLCLSGFPMVFRVSPDHFLKSCIFSSVNFSIWIWPCSDSAFLTSYQSSSVFWLLPVCHLIVIYYLDFDTNNSWITSYKAMVETVSTNRLTMTNLTSSPVF